MPKEQQDPEAQPEGSSSPVVPHPDTTGVSRTMAALLTTGTSRLSRAECDAILQVALGDIPEAERLRVVSMLEQRGLLPDADGVRRVAELPPEQQGVLKDPDGLLLQCMRLAHSAGAVAQLTGASDKNISDVKVAGALLNSGKARQFAGLEAGRAAGQPPQAMLEGYELREQEDYAAIAGAGLAPQAVQILQENIRHDPSALRTPEGRLLYYLLYCQRPDNGVLVPVEERINDSIHKHPIYGSLYQGYAATHDGMDLVRVHQETVAKIEMELAEALFANGHSFEDIKAFFNEKLQ